MDQLDPLGDQSAYEATLDIEPMDPEKRDMWADALESGEFTQGRDALARIDKRGKATYCCLGVLCELAVRAGVIPAGTRRIEQGPELSYRLKYGEGEAELTLPHEVVVWAGLNMASPRVSIVDDEAAKRIIHSELRNPRSVPLETLNDNHHPFSSIAKMIRTSL